ncbi:taurine ABC transporter ATP-binding protein [Pseudochelatococcus sp. B33]
MSRLSLKDVTIQYGNAPPVIENLSLAFGPRDFVTVLGPSGSGKTTLLKLAAGFLQPTGGEVLVNGEKITGPGADRGVVFQDDALLPWFDALENTALSLKLRGVPAREYRPRAEAVLSRLGLAGFERRKIWELSGGQRQRVGLARALMAEPHFLLMDEPFGALDALTRAQMHEVVLDLWQRLRPGILFITHDVEEALLLGTRLVVLAARPGRIAQEFHIDFGARLAGGEPPRTVRSDPAFVDLRERILDLVFGRAAA